MNKLFLQLVRFGIGHEIMFQQEVVDWSKLKSLAAKHGLDAVVLDGIEKMPSDIRPPQELLLAWIGGVLQNYESHYDKYCKAMSELAGFYNSHGYKMMILKGYACSQDWPKSNHRPCGDIDIWLFGLQKEADSLLEREKGLIIDNAHHHHSVFLWRDFSVENHYDFINVYHHKSHKRLEKLFKELAFDDTYYEEVYGERVYLPSPKLHALFLLKHTMLHFVSGEICLRQLLDWAFFVERHTKKIDWGWLEKTLDEYGMMPLYQLFNAICVEDLGFSSQLFPSVQFNPDLKEKVLTEILKPDQVHNINKRLVPRMVSSFRRWRDSSWKHELCYKESMWIAFWYGVWGHLLKPSSI